MLVDGDAAEKAKAHFIASRHDRLVAGAGAAQHVAGEDRGAGRRSANDATPHEDVVECLLGLRAGVAIHEMPLPATLEPHAASARDHRGERIAVGDVLVRGVQDDHVLRPCSAQEIGAAPLGWVGGVAARGGYVHDESVGPARRLDESRHDIGAERAAAHDHDRSCRWPHLRAGPRVQL